MGKSVTCHQRWRHTGRSIRGIIFVFNAIAWIVAMMCLVGGALVGFYSRSLMLFGMGLIDFWLATPVTIFLYYGAALGIVTGAGCFAGSGGRWWWTGIYFILIILLFLFDWFLGIHVFFSTTSLVDFLDSIPATMNSYGKNDGKKFGIFPVPITVYWDHVQNQGHCCGFNKWEDWKNTTIGKKRSLPDSCCNERYAHFTCGEDLLHHPDKYTNFKNTEHLMTDVIHVKSCLSGYPKLFIAFFNEASIIGLGVAVILLFCFILSVVLFFFVVFRQYKPGQKLNHPNDRSNDDYPGKRLKNMNPHPDEKKKSRIFGRSKEVDGPVRVRGKGEWDKYKVAPVHRFNEDEKPPRQVRFDTGPTRHEQKAIKTENPPPQQTKLMDQNDSRPGRRNSSLNTDNPPNAKIPANTQTYGRSNKVAPM